jgi:hypothetical protein
MWPWKKTSKYLEDFKTIDRLLEPFTAAFTFLVPLSSLKNTIDMHVTGEQQWPPAVTEDFRGILMGIIDYVSQVRQLDNAEFLEFARDYFEYWLGSGFEEEAARGVSLIQQNPPPPFVAIGGEYAHTVLKALTENESADEVSGYTMKYADSFLSLLEQKYTDGKDISR